MCSFIMENVHDDYLKTINEINRKTKSLMHPQFTENSFLYPFTTENLSGYVSKLNVKNKDVLTVTGSSDQMFNLIFFGAKSVSNFDLNRNTYYLSNLKLAALKCLSYNEFLNFFSGSEDSNIDVLFQKRINDNNNVFDYNTYLRVRKNMDPISACYFDFMYSYYNNNGVDLYRNLCVNANIHSAIINNDYLKNEDNYNKTKELIDNTTIKYYQKDLLNLHSLSEQYDVILLSNIYDYLTSDWNGIISAEEFNSYIEQNLSNLIRQNGIISLSYQYHYKVKNKIYKSALEKLFASSYKIDTNHELDKISNRKILVPSFIKEYRKNNEKDCVYLIDGGRKR